MARNTQVFSKELKIDHTRDQRSDIQALRGFAVLIVLLYHAKLGVLQAGYLGVDIFFVISGFLITGLVKKGIERGDFRFTEFYFRRAKRLLPAAYVTFAVTAVLAPFLLAAGEMADFQAQMWGALTFTANFVLWQQSGYFQGAAHLKPLLHVWSLAIEEQYYFILPALMCLVPRRLWKPAAAVVFVGSLALCVFMVDVKPIAAFYLLPTRGWELAIGSIGALVTIDGRAANVVKLAFWPAVMILLLLPMVSIANYHPGPDAVLVCLATLVVILRKHPLLSRGRVVHAMSRVGDMSYSLYLVHWPIFAFLANVWIDKDKNSAPPLALRLGLVVLSMMLAYLQNRFVEEPARRADIKKSVGVVVKLLLASLTLALVMLGIARAMASEKNYAYLLRGNYGLNEACDFKSDFSPIPACRNSDAPGLMVWGDSYAMHLVPGLLASTTGAPPMVQATRSACGPLLGVAPIRRSAGPGYANVDAQNCLAFNESVIRYLEHADSVKTVVLSSPFNVVVDNTNYQLLKRGTNGQNGLLRVDAGVAAAAEGIKATVDRLRALGKKVVVIAPPPQAEFDIGRCLERFDSGLPTIGITAGCKINVVAYKNSSAQVLQLLQALPKVANVDVVGFDDILCRGDFCETYINNVLIYRDAGHFSYDGSVLVSNTIDLLEKIRQSAR